MSVVIGPENVPEGFFLNQTGRAEQLIQEYGRTSCAPEGSKSGNPSKESE